MNKQDRKVVKTTRNSSSKIMNYWIPKMVEARLAEAKTQDRQLKAASWQRNQGGWMTWLPWILAIVAAIAAAIIHVRNLLADNAETTIR